MAGDRGLQVVALVPFAIGLTLLLPAMASFVVVGHGTPAPFDPPKDLVLEGWYQVTRCTVPRRVGRVRRA